MIVYRLEHASEPSPISHNVNDGPYRTSDRIGYRAGGNSGYANDKHPLPENDRLLSDWWDTTDTKYDWVFCFSSLEQLHRWFFDNIEMSMMDIEGIARIGIYKVPDNAYKAGQFQSVMLANAVQLVDTCKCSYKP